MIVLVLKDGLGNQLFQYAAAAALTHQLGTDLRIDTGSYKSNSLRTYALQHFNIPQRFVSPMQVFLHRGRNLMLRIGIAKMSHRYHEKNFRFNPAFFEIPDGSWIEGYWQSEKYFQVIEQEIRKEFRINSTPDGTNLSILEKMKSVAAVSLHIRRGDFVSDKVTNELHGVCSLSYYEQAIAHIRNHVSDPHFFIFSDDMEWVRENLPVQDLRVDYMDHNGPKDYEDLRLMYSCRHHITANSSFSWWGAWLNDSKDKIVVCPEDWTKGPYQNPDIFPDGWIRLKG